MKTNRFLVRVVIEWGKTFDDHIVTDVSLAKSLRDSLIKSYGPANCIDGNFCIFDDPLYGHITGYCITLI